MSDSMSDRTMKIKNKCKEEYVEITIDDYRSLIKIYKDLVRTYQAEKAALQEVMEKYKKASRAAIYTILSLDINLMYMERSYSDVINLIGRWFRHENENGGKYEDTISEKK